MRIALALTFSLVASGCYASHGPEAGDRCEEPTHEVFVRNDCTFCNAIHLSWLRRCGANRTA